MTKSNKEQILENLILPLQGVFGAFNDGAIVYLLEHCQEFTTEELKKGVNTIIQECEFFPYPATIIKHLPKKKSYNVWKN